MTPVISIIVAVYKAESCLRRCVDSLLAQTFQDYEILLVDDGSPDRSGENFATSMPGRTIVSVYSIKRMVE